jgi:peptidoglycan/LPS O-acetylase OafA/YrhL
LGQVGFYSYSIYLWHVDLAQTPIKKVLQFTAGYDVPPALTWAVAMGVYVLLACAVGAVMARCLEIPSLALRDRLFPSAVKPMLAVETVPLVGEVAFGKNGLRSHEPPISNTLNAEGAQQRGVKTAAAAANSAV